MGKKQSTLKKEIGFSFCQNEQILDLPNNEIKNMNINSIEFSSDQNILYLACTSMHQISENSRGVFEYSYLLIYGYYPLTCLSNL